MTQRRIKIAPSLLSADFGHLADDIRRVEQAGCDLLHVDVMDGHFVPNITVGPVVVRAIRKITSLPLDVHLMISEPGRYIQSFADAGANHITVHAEASAAELPDHLKAIRACGCTAGASLRPPTGLDPIRKWLDQIDMVLLMAVEPGFGGQAFMPDVLPKIRALRSLYRGDIEVDGGINHETAPAAVEAGANVLVAGTAIFGQKDPAHAVIQFKQTIGALPHDKN